jgi:hypothetical protein
MEEPNYEQLGNMEKPNYEQLRFNAPPIGTSLPSDYTRGLSIGSLEWTDNSRANTPVDHCKEI